MDDDLLSEGCIVCPACGEELEFDLSELTDEDLGGIRQLRALKSPRRFVNNGGFSKPPDMDNLAQLEGASA